MSPPTAATIRSRAARTSATIGSTHGVCGSSAGIDMRVISHQFVGCTQDRHLVTCQAAHGLYERALFRIGDMRRIPSQKVRNALGRSDGDVQGIRPGIRGQSSPLQQGESEHFRLGRSLERPQSRQEGRPPDSGGRIAIRAFQVDQLRDHYLERATAPVPPLMGQLLSARHDQIAGRPRRKVADDRGLQVHQSGHTPSVPELALPQPRPD